jgi:hypothetical protein
MVFATGEGATSLMKTLSYSNPAKRRAEEPGLSADPLLAAAVARIIEAGWWAPTPDNWQSWQFRWTGECIEIFWDFETGTSFLDVEHGVAYLSIGGAVTNMEIIANAEGYDVRVDLRSQADSSRPTARVFLEPASKRSSSLAALIPERCTNRRAYARTRLEPEMVERLDGLGDICLKTRLSMLYERDEIENIGAMAGDFDQFFLHNSNIHDVIFRWIRWTQEEVLRTRDGLPLGSLELSSLDRLGLMVVRKWTRAKALARLGMGRRLASRAAKLYASSGAFGVISLPEMSAEAAFEAGRLLEKIWLVAAEKRLAFQPIAGPALLIMRNRLKGGAGLDARLRDWAIEVERDLRSLCRFEEGTLPILLFRVGEAAPPSARALRRPLDAVARNVTT